MTSEDIHKIMIDKDLYLGKRYDSFSFFMDSRDKFFLLVKIAFY